MTEKLAEKVHYKWELDEKTGKLFQIAKGTYKEVSAACHSGDSGHPPQLITAIPYVSEGALAAFLRMVADPSSPRLMSYLAD